MPAFCPKRVISTYKNLEKTQREVTRSYLGEKMKLITENDQCARNNVKP
jgi:hypothetical protein